MIRSFKASPVLVIACAGVALTMISAQVGAQPAPGAASTVPQSHMLNRNTSSLSAADFSSIRNRVQPKVKWLSQLPASINPAVLSVSGASSPGAPGLSTTGRGPTIASAGTTAVTPKPSAISSSAGHKGIDNYGNLYGVSSPYHYNDILIDGAEYFDYPQSVTGMLWTTQNGGASWGWCSASLIGRMIGVAAGHCVRENRTWINGGIYIPACLNCGRFDADLSKVYAPFGYAWVYWAETTGGWFANEGIDKGYDISVFVVGTRVGTANFPGDYTGWNGICLLNCLQPAWALRQTGFPFDYAGGNYMYEGQHLDVSDGSDYVEGSGAGPGSSGGPWVSNAGVYPAANYDLSSDKGQFPFGNIVFATTSWGYNCANNTSCSQKFQGGSPLSGPSNNNDGRGTGFKGMYNDACSLARSLFGTSSCSFL